MTVNYNQPSKREFRNSMAAYSNEAIDTLHHVARQRLNSVFFHLCRMRCGTYATSRKDKVEQLFEIYDCLNRVEGVCARHWQKDRVFVREEKVNEV